MVSYLICSRSPWPRRSSLYYIIWYLILSVTGAPDPGEAISITSYDILSYLFQEPLAQEKQSLLHHMISYLICSRSPWPRRSSLYYIVWYLILSVPGAPDPGEAVSITSYYILSYLFQEPLTQEKQSLLHRMSTRRSTRGRHKSHQATELIGQYSSTFLRSRNASCSRSGDLVLAFFLTLKQLGLRNTISLSGVIRCKYNIFVCHWSITINTWSATWILMPWRFGTGHQ